jgi:hypothetical protein
MLPFRLLTEAGTQTLSALSFRATDQLVHEPEPFPQYLEMESYLPF